MARDVSSLMSKGVGCGIKQADIRQISLENQEMIKEETGMSKAKVYELDCLLFSLNDPILSVRTALKYTSFWALLLPPTFQFSFSLGQLGHILPDNFLTFYCTDTCPSFLFAQSPLHYLKLLLMSH